MSNNCSTFPISVPNSQTRQRRGSLGATFTDLFAMQNNPPPASGLQAIGSNTPSAEDTVAEDVESASPGAMPNLPFAQRVSGAQALWKSCTGSIGNGEGFNWTEALRSRAERAPSIGGPISRQSPQSRIRHPGQHQWAASVATIEQPIREISKQFEQNKPDFFQEKILRGDFME